MGAAALECTALRRRCSPTRAAPPPARARSATQPPAHPPPPRLPPRRPPRGQLKAIDHNCNDIPDAAMTAAVAALLADGPTAIRDVYNWRVKETERMKVCPPAVATSHGLLCGCGAAAAAWLAAACLHGPLRLPPAQPPLRPPSPPARNQPAPLPAACTLPPSPPPRRPSSPS